MMNFYLTNTLTGKKELFKTQVPGKVFYYSCGPTVYGPLHIGNARAHFVGDLIYRWLKHLGYEVFYVRNYTDVDDKIIHRAAEERKTPFEVSEYYIQYCEEDMQTLGLLPPTRTVKVTESIPAIIRLIEKIIQQGKAYVVDHEVFFSVEDFKDYGKLSGRRIEDQQAGARVHVDSKKKNPADFTLWKPAKAGEPFWESPWGPGRPGWHIECSAMIAQWLGETIDLHHGGQDLIFPHHENEIAQSEAAHGKAFCHHWVHHGFLTFGDEKMSKSVGNIITMRQFMNDYSAELLKMMFLSFQYRSSIPYSEGLLIQTLNELERVYIMKAWAEKRIQKSPVPPAFFSGEIQSFIEQTHQLFSLIEKEMQQDLNSAAAVGHVFAWIREFNRTIHPDQTFEGEAYVAHLILEVFNQRLFPLLNVFGENAEQYLHRIQEIRKKFREVNLSNEQISQYIEERNQARKNKNFQRSDEIRQLLEEQGIILLDSPSGTTWKVNTQIEKK